MTEQLQIPAETTQPEPDRILNVVHNILHRLIERAHISDDERRELHADLRTIIDPTAPNAAQMRNAQDIAAKKQRLADLQAEIVKAEGK